MGSLPSTESNCQSQTTDLRCDERPEGARILVITGCSGKVGSPPKPDGAEVKINEKSGAR
jgi:hypothetical protein